MKKKMPLDEDVSKILNATYILNGFDLKWLWVPHRISTIGVSINNIHLQNEKLCALMQPTMVGGSHGRKIKYDYQLFYSPIKTETTTYFHGRTPIIELIDGQGKGRVEIPIKKCGLQGLKDYQYTVLVRGFNLDTLPPHEKFGFTTKGFGAWVLPAQIKNGKLQFDFEMRLIANSPRFSRFTGWITDIVDNLRLRKDEEKKEIAGKKVRDPREVDPGYISNGFIDYTIVAAPNGYITNWPDAEIEPSRLYRLKNLKQPNKFKSLITIRGTNQIIYPHAFVGINGFFFELNKDFPKDYGIYVQQTHFENQNFQYDPLTGIMEFNTYAYLRNDPTRITRNKTLTNVQARFSLIQTHDDPHQRIKEKKIKGRTKANKNQGTEIGLIL